MTDRSRVSSVEAGPIRRDAMVVRHWGDDDGAGHVNDHVYVSSERLYQIVLTMPSGASFRHSERNRTIFGADELYLVLRGTFVLANPETGEVLRLEEGDAAVFGPDTWHHGFVVGATDAEVLEYFAPPPAAGMSQAYARTKPYLDTWTYGDDGDGARHPQRPRRVTMRRIDRGDVLWRIDGDGGPLVGTLLSTPELLVETYDLAPKASTEGRAAGDVGLYVRGGNVGVELSGSTFDLAPGDGCFLPMGTTYRITNAGADRATWVAGSAPSPAPRS